MSIAWVLGAVTSLVIGLLGERILGIRARRQSEKLAALKERLDVYANYAKLASLRRAETEETLAGLHREAAEMESEILSLQSAVTDDAALTPMEFYCVDRVARSGGPLWYVAVEALDATAPWAGIRTYAVAAESAEDARKRITERHPSPTSFAISPAVPLVLPER
ncbi:hypothetical protein J2848_005562 [Azospirillum lipoferum]|uniref:DUF4446 family protein n=1 Tax=Azospirillum lipoferum TaxID=193 RepID=A0A5A9GWE9_AZOLI|nr:MULTISPECIES: hypothetical protein [Azospirillum]KAA0598025.1 hypothetical protein FZ942_02705 [Azospirillum lipoferum]MCP1613865.1 hypothetical protein [Azospirillum lipoferum]MDW5534682.1 hypothetical protein [Azospirillum sp. NL1]